MKVKLVPNAELEFVSPDELRKILAELREEQPRAMRVPEAFVGDANGNIGVTSDAIVYQVPVGFEFRIHLIRVSCDGHANAGQQLQHAAAYYQMLAGDQPIDDASLDAAGIKNEAVPFTHTFARDQGPIARNAEQLKVVVSGLGLAANTRYSVYVQGTLVRPELAIAEPA